MALGDPVELWRFILSPIFNPIGLGFRYVFFSLTGNKKSLSYLNRGKRSEGERTSQKTWNIIIGILFISLAIIVLILNFIKYDVCY